MAIAFDSTSSLSTSAWTSGSSASWTHTPVGTPTKVFVGVFYNAATDIFTSVTYGGQAMTQVGTVQNNSTDWERLYYIDNPPAGAQTIQLTLSSSSSFISGGASAYTGTASGLDSSNSVKRTGATPFAYSTTVVASNCWLVGFTRVNAALTGMDTGTTNRGAYNAGGCSINDSNATVSTGSQSLGVTYTGSFTGLANIASIAPAASTNTKGLLMLFG